MSAAEVRRLFFALWPPEPVRDDIVAAQADIDTRTGRAVPRENLHLTLQFIGAADEARTHCLVDMASAYSGKGFELVLDTPGYWRRPQVLWLGSEQTPEALRALVSALRLGAAQCGCEPETRSFEVHLTLFRKVARAPRLARAIATPVVWPVDSFCLVESVLDPTGAVYQILKKWDLR